MPTAAAALKAIPNLPPAMLPSAEAASPSGETSGPKSRSAAPMASDRPERKAPAAVRPAPRKSGARARSRPRLLPKLMADTAPVRTGPTDIPKPRRSDRPWFTASRSFEVRVSSRTAAASSVLPAISSSSKPKRDRSPPEAWSAWASFGPALAPKASMAFWARSKGSTVEAMSARSACSSAGDSTSPRTFVRPVMPALASTPAALKRLMSSVPCCQPMLAPWRTGASLASRSCDSETLPP